MSERSLKVYYKFLYMIHILPYDIIYEIFKHFIILPKERRIIKSLNSRIKHSKSCRLFIIPNTNYVKLVIAHKKDKYPPIITSLNDNMGIISFYKKGVEVILKYDSIFKTFSFHAEILECYEYKTYYHTSDIYYFIAVNISEINKNVFTPHNKNYDELYLKNDLYNIKISMI
jgi:hypothetical protein